ncbi:MAG: radical SAM protein [Candidatus Rokubacteria bacterium]|nr:radical SAM protein [Candidatus Rokubacteria bacterium]
MSAFPGADASRELAADECRRVVDEIALVNPNAFLILTGGEPLLRKDIFELAGYAAEKHFTVVLGTNGVLLRERQARLMRQHGIMGASISLDSTERKKHDEFRHLRGAWDGAVRATEALRAEGLDFSLHMTVTDWNMGEIPAMIDLANELAAKVLNLFFLVRTGRGRSLTDISPDQYERILSYLARVQGVGDGLPFEDPWSTPVGKAGPLLIRAKCAPHFRRILWELDPQSPLLRNYAHGSCPAGKYYCRITPEGDVTPCPYMPVAAGNLRRTSFANLWEEAKVFNDLREPKLGGRCGVCEFSKICGGCRCRAYATYGDYLAEDPACGYQPGQHGGGVVELPAEQTFGLPVSTELVWENAARERLQVIPSFARGMVAKAVEAYARSTGRAVITPEIMTEVRQRWGARFRPRE